MTNKKLHITEEDFARYLDNEMTGTERNLFEKELQKHPFETEAIEGFESISIENIKNDLNEIKAKIKPQQRNCFRCFAAAASVLLIVSAGIVWMEVKDQNTLSEMAETKNIEKLEEGQEKPDIIIEPAQLKKEIEKTIYSEEIPQVENETETSVIAKSIIIKDEPRQKSARKESRTIKQVAQPTEQKKAAVSSVAPDADETKNISFARTERKAKNQVETDEYQILDDAPVSAVVAAPIAAPPAVKEMIDLTALPNGGFDIFNTYIDSTTLLPENYKKKKAVVKIEFKIDSQGVISDFTNKNDADSFLFAKAKEIILNGPKWSPEIKDGERLDSTVKLKIIFRK